MNKKIICAICGQEYEYIRGKGCSKNICGSCRQSYRRKLLKHKAVIYKGGKCQKCGYDKCEEALDFHHLDASEKDFQISGKWNVKWDVLKSELDKCIMLCSNCHREEHSKNNIPLEYYEKFITPQKERERIQKEKKINKQKELEEKAKKYNTSVEAIKRIRFGGRKIDRPTKEVFFKEFEEVGFNKSIMARKYGISVNGIKRWIRSYDKNGI